MSFPARPRILSLFWIAAVAILHTFSSLSAQNSFSYPIVVTNAAPIARTAEPTASGLAVPRDVGLLDTNFLRLVDGAGLSVPVQFKVLSRWGGVRTDATKPVKWILVEFLASCPPSANATYYVVDGLPMPGQIATQSTATELIVTTGAAVFTIDKTAPSVLKTVKIGATNILGAPGSIDLVDTSGLAVGATVLSTVVEESGSVRTVVRQKGTLALGGLEFTTRYYFWTARKDLKIDFRLENNQSLGLPNMGTPHVTYFDQLALTLRLAGNISTVTTPTVQRSTSPSQTWDLRQTFSMPSNQLQMLNGFSFVETQNGGTLATGGRHEGTVGVLSGSRAIAVGVDRFWQNFPKSFTANGNRITVGLFPSYGAGPYYTGQFGVPLPATSSSVDPASVQNFRFEGGRWKTHTIHLDFSKTGLFSSAQLGEMANRIEKPLMVRSQDLEVPFFANAFGQLATSRLPWGDTAKDRYERLMDVTASDAAADNQPSLGQIGFPEFRNRGGTYGGGQFFGWENFGDIVWGDGYASLHYDMPYVLLLNWYRTGNFAFFDIGRDMATHRRDYDQYHSKSPSDPSRGGQFYEKGWFHGNFAEPQQSHTWVHGLLMHYALTGDEGSREAAIECFTFIQNHHPELWDGWWGARILGWDLENLVDLYNYIGDPAYLSLAGATAQRWIVIEAQNGGQGYVVNPGYGTNPHCEVWMHTIVTNALVKYWMITGDPATKQAVIRMANWYLNACIAQFPTGSPNARSVGKVWTDWAPSGWHQAASVHHSWGMIEALSNAAYCSGNIAYWSVAKDFFESTTRYYQGTTNDASQNYNLQTSWNAIAFRMLGYPNSESKIMSNLGRWGHAFLAVDRYAPLIF